MIPWLGVSYSDENKLGCPPLNNAWDKLFLFLFFIYYLLIFFFQILTPFLLRRLKSDVELEVPPKKEVLVYAPLTKKQQEFYKATLNKTILNIVGSQKVKLVSSLSNNTDFFYRDTTLGYFHWYGAALKTTASGSLGNLDSVHMSFTLWASNFYYIV